MINISLESDSMRPKREAFRPAWTYNTSYTTVVDFIKAVKTIQIF